MKQTLVFLLLALLYVNSAKAQQKISTTIKRLPESKLWTYDNEKEYRKGAIFELQDSSILLSSSFVKEDYYSGNYTVSKILIEDIKLIQTRKPGGGGKGLVLGGGIGFSVGALLGAMGGNDDPGLFSYTAGEKAVIGGVTLGAIGGVLGLIIGSVKIKIPINGSMDMYHRTTKLDKSKITYSTK